VREGRHPDVLEIDAASNNSVEDVRELRERILLAPMLSQHKVVILDEAHMMSKSAFNALLKTLEEPPEHVIFVFATTEPERMPPTILSRTQHFRFRRLSEGEIVEKLGRILTGLKRQAEPEALKLVARMADGAMRDGESLLDRLLTLEGKLTLKQTEAALGLPPQEALFALAEALDAGRIRDALEQSQGLYTQGFAARSLAQGLLEAIRAGLYARMGLGSGPHLSASEEHLVAAMTALDQAMERLLKRSDALALELAVLAAYQAIHAALPPAAQPTPAPRPAPGLPDFSPRPQRPTASQQTALQQTALQQAEDRVQSTEGTEQQDPPPASHRPPLTSQGVKDLAQEWRQVMNHVKMSLRGFIREAEPRFEEGKLVLLFPEKASFHFQSAQKNLDSIRAAVREVMGDLEVELHQGGVKKKLVDEPAKPGFSFPVKPSTLSSQAVVPIAAPAPVAPPPPVAPKVAPPEPAPQPKAAEQTAERALAGQTIELTPAEQTAQSDPPSKLLTLDPAKLEADPVPQAKAAQPYMAESTPFTDEPLFPEDVPLSEPSDEGPDELPAARNEGFFLNDPKFQALTRMFGGRVRKVYRDKPKEPETAEGEGNAAGEAEGEA
jgi:DNA polymerase-3 subunit gamma/tau